MIVYEWIHGLTLAIWSSSSGNAGNAAELREGEPDMGEFRRIQDMEFVVNNLIIVIGYHYVLLLY